MGLKGQRKRVVHDGAASKNRGSRGSARRDRRMKMMDIECKRGREEKEEGKMNVRKRGDRRR